MPSGSPPLRPVVILESVNGRVPEEDRIVLLDMLPHEPLLIRGWVSEGRGRARVEEATLGVRGLFVPLELEDEWPGDWLFPGLDHPRRAFSVRIPAEAVAYGRLELAFSVRSALGEWERAARLALTLRPRSSRMGRALGLLRAIRASRQALGHRLTIGSLANVARAVIQGRCAELFRCVATDALNAGRETGQPVHPSCLARFQPGPSPQPTPAPVLTLAVLVRDPDAWRAHQDRPAMEVRPGWNLVLLAPEGLDLPETSGPALRIPAAASFGQIIAACLDAIPGPFLFSDQSASLPPDGLDRLASLILDRKDALFAAPFAWGPGFTGFPSPGRTMAPGPEDLDGCREVLARLRDPGTVRLPFGPAPVLLVSGAAARGWRTWRGDRDAGTFFREAGRRGMHGLLADNVLASGADAGWPYAPFFGPGGAWPEALESLDPAWVRQVLAFARDDEAAGPRNAAWALGLARGAEGVLALVDHAIGGGANICRDEMVRKRTARGLATLLITYTLADRCYNLDFLHPRLSARLVSSQDMTVACKALGAFPGVEIMVNNLVTYPAPLRFLECLRETAARIGARAVWMMHDYFSVCPTIYLLNAEGVHCGGPSPALCSGCLTHNPRRYMVEGSEDIEGWRQVFGAFLREASEIVCFSESSREFLRRAYPDIPPDRMVLRPHQVEPLPPARYEPDPGTLCIGILGGQAIHKGSAVVREMAGMVSGRGDGRIRLVQFGAGAEHEGLPQGLTRLGPYRRDDLPALAAREKVDIFLIPSVCPETFSLSASEIMSMDLPLAVFDVGAPAERVRRYARGVVIPEPTGRAALGHILDWAARAKGFGGGASRPREAA